MNTTWITGTWFPLFVNLCLQSTVVLALATVTLLACRRRSSALRHVIAATALGLLIVLPILSIMPPMPISGIARLQRQPSTPVTLARIGVADPMPLASNARQTPPTSPTPRNVRRVPARLRISRHPILFWTQQMRRNLLLQHISSWRCLFYG